MAQEDQMFINNPAEYFSNPQQLADSKKLSTEKKMLALKQWEMDIRQQLVATEENMQSSSTAALTEVHDAMRSIGHEPGGSHTGAAKAGHPQ